MSSPIDKSKGAALRLVSKPGSQAAVMIDADGESTGLWPSNER
ncbi:MAG: hypothetical protein ACREHD_23040 [Pirellulales bacterium]